MKHHLSKKEIKELREGKKKITKYALKEFNKKLSKKKLQDLSVDEIAKIAEALERIERKIDNAMQILNPPRIDIKGYPVKNSDWRDKVYYYKTKGNRE